MISFSTEVNPFIILQIIIFVLQIHIALYIYRKYQEVRKFRKDLDAVKFELDYYKKRYDLHDPEEDVDKK